jgi:formylglycine-generating enzyme required for sulfatase activity
MRVVIALLAGSVLVQTFASRCVLAADAPAGDAKPFTQTIPGSTITFDMVPIPAGKFLMGSPATEKGRKEDEGPQFQVQVDPFFMGKYTVTQTEYNYFLSNYQRLASAGAPTIPKDKLADAVTYPTPMYELEAGPVLDRMGRGANFPAVIMSQFAARQYTKWLSKKTGRFYRLPTEAEWEYACRAGTTTAYSFGDDPALLKDYGWYIDNSDLSDGDGGYHPVGQKKPNPWGLYDMHGNVAQWCIDQYSPTQYQQFQGKTPDWHDVIDWPTKQYPRVLRGGSWESEPEACRSAARTPSDRSMNDKDPQLPQSPHWLSDGFWIGFRVIAPLKEPSEEEKNRYWNADDANTIRTIQRDREIRELLSPPALVPDK